MSVYVFGGGCVWREILRAVGEVARKTLSAHLFCLVWVLPWDQVGRAWLGATELAFLNRAAGGWMVRLKVFLSSGIGSGRVIWLIQVLVAIFMRWFRYKNVK